MNYKSGFLLTAVIFAFLAMFISSPALAYVCDVNVYGLDVQGSKIIGYIENEGTCMELISYGIYVNDEAVRTGSFELNISTTRKIEHTYSFGHGEYTIELRAEADCDASDSETIIHNILEPYMCQNPSGFEGQDYCDYTNTRYLICQDGEWVVEDVNAGEYCYNCNACGDDVCNCGETSDTCWSDCGNICTPQYLDSYRCNGDWRQRLYRNSDCEYEWRDWYRCEYDCFDGRCVDDYDDCSAGWKCKDSYRRGYQRSDCSWSYVTYCSEGCYDGYCRDNGPDGRCGVSIEAVDYITEVTEGSPAWAKVTMKNTGNREETLTAKLYIDGSYWSALKAEDVYAGSQTIKNFNFYLNEGLHNLRIEAEADCGSEDSEYFSINVHASVSPQPQTCNYNGVCEYGESYNTCPHDCPKPEPVPSYVTSIDVHPKSLDIEKFATGVVSIDITSSKDQTFTITVSGVEDTWTSHQGSLEMEAGTKRVYLYITPDQEGTHALSLKVSAESEDKEFTETVSFYVSPTGQAGSGITGFITGASGNFALVVVIIIIVVVVLLYIGFRKLRPEEEFASEEGFEEPEFPEEFETKSF